MDTAARIALGRTALAAAEQAVDLILTTILAAERETGIVLSCEQRERWARSAVNDLLRPPASSQSSA